MMNEHLPVIFTAFFNVENDKLVNEESEFCEVVEFDEAGDTEMVCGVVCP